MTRPVRDRRRLPLCTDAES